MTNLQNSTSEKILWLDLEMTGLHPQTDRILEVAAIVTDWQFNELASFETGVRQDKAAELLTANPFAVSRPVETQELLEHSMQGMSEQEAENELIEFVNRFFSKDEPVLLAGNSIHMDRQFIRAYWPELEQHLHYRMLDVSAWKVVMQGKYHLSFTKQEKHRALDDIRESVAELKSYLRHFKSTDSQEKE